VPTASDTGRRRTRASGKAQAVKGKAGMPEVSPEKLAAALKSLADCVGRLGHIHARTTTVERALIGNDAEQDPNIARCVRVDIADALFAEITKLIAIGRRLGVKIRHPFDP
jgi:hypothetical protein